MLTLDERVPLKYVPENFHRLGYCVFQDVSNISVTLFRPTLIIHYLKSVSLLYFPFYSLSASILGPSPVSGCVRTPEVWFPPLS